MTIIYSKGKKLEKVAEGAMPVVAEGNIIDSKQLNRAVEAAIKGDAQRNNVLEDVLYGNPSGETSEKRNALMIKIDYDPKKKSYKYEIYINR